MSQWVYFLRGKDSGRFKIGFAKCPKARLRDIQSGSTEDIVGVSAGSVKGGTPADAMALEGRIHARFAHLRWRNEIFRPSPSLIKLAKSFPPFADHSCSVCDSITLPNRHRSKWEPRPVKKQSLIKIPKELRIKQHRPLFNPRKTRDEYGGQVEHFRVGFSLTKYNRRVDRYIPSLG